MEAHSRGTFFFFSCFSYILSSHSHCTIYFDWLSDLAGLEQDMTSCSSGAKLLLSGLPPRTQIALDAHSETFVTNDQFSGIKSLPPGWHCISWSIASAEPSSGDTAGPSESSVRNILLRWFDKDETVVRELDRLQERLVVPDQLGSSSSEASRLSSIGRSRRHRVTRTADLNINQNTATLITPDVLGSIEPSLLPYPADAKAAWQRATQHLSLKGGAIGRKVVARTLGVDRTSSDSTTDSLATGPSRGDDVKDENSLSRNEGNPGRREDGKLIWGRSRPQTESFEVDVDGEDSDETQASAVSAARKRSASSGSDDGEEQDEEVLFTTFDLRRSWPASSVGAEITRWSQDKSWLLQQVALRSRLGIADSDSREGWYVPLLCEFELAFVLFIMATNAYAFEQWKDLIALFCRSSSMLGAQSAFQLHPSTTDDHPHLPEGTAVDLNAHVAFLITLKSQLSILPTDFWSSQSTTQQESHLLKQLDVLRSNIARSLSTPSEEHQKAHEHQREQLVKAWRTLSHSTASRFGWTLDSRLDEEAEVEGDIEAEEGEDAPVVVDL